MKERILIFLIFFSVFFFPDRNLDPLFVILFSLSGILLIKKILKRSEGFKINFNYLSIPFLSFPILIFFATFFSSYKYASFLRLGEIILIYFVFLLFNIFSEEEKKFTVNVLILLSVLHSIYSIIKYFMLHQQRAGGNFLNPNHSAFVLLGGLFLVLGRYYKDKNKLLLFITLPLFLSIILSRSRSSILAIILMLPLFFFGKKKLKLMLFSISFLLLILLIFSLLPNPLSRYILRTYDPFSFRRIEIWGAGLRIFLDNWIYGVGPSNFYYRVEPYRFPEERRAARFAITFRDAHNDYIQLLSEMGLFAIPFLAGILFLSINLLKNILLSQDRREKGLALAILSFLFNSFFTNSLFYLPVYFILIFLLANLNPFDRGFTITIYLKNLHKIALIFIFLFTLISAGYIPYISNEYFRKGLIVSRVGNIDDGLKKLKIAERLTPLSSDVKNELGRVYKLYYIRTNHPFYLWSSYYELSESLKLNPNQAISHAELAELFTILLKREKNSEAFALAEHHWKEAISLAPFNPFYCFNLSQLYYNHFKNKEAEEVLKKCLELEPNFIMAHYFLYKIYEEMGEVKKREREKQITGELIKKFGNRNYPSTYFIMLFSVPENVVKEITGEEKLEVK